MVLFMILYPLAEELKKKHELSSALINKGMDMRNVSRRNKAVRVLLTMWKDRRGHQCGVTPEVTPEVSPEVDLEENVLVSVLLAYPYHSVIADAHHTQKKQLKLMQERLSNWEFQSPPPFVPRKPGLKRKSFEGNSVFVGNVEHTRFIP